MVTSPFNSLIPVLYCGLLEILSILKAQKLLMCFGWSFSLHPLSYILLFEMHQSLGLRLVSRYSCIKFVCVDILMTFIFKFICVTLFVMPCLQIKASQSIKTVYETAALCQLYKLTLTSLSSSWSPICSNLIANGTNEEAAKLSRVISKNVKDLTFKILFSCSQIK